MPEGPAIKNKWKVHWETPPVEWKVCPENTESRILFERIKLIKQFAEKRRGGHQGGNLQLRNWGRGAQRRSRRGVMNGWKDGVKCRSRAQTGSRRDGGQWRCRLGCCGVKIGLRTCWMGFMVHSGWPQWNFTEALDLGLDLDLNWRVGLRLDVGLGRRFSLLLLLQEDLVVQELQLGRVPVDQGKTKITTKKMTLYMVKMREAQCTALIN